MKKLIYLAILLIIIVSGCIHRNTVVETPIPYYFKPAPQYTIIEKGCFHQFEWTHERVVENTCIKK